MKKFLISVIGLIVLGLVVSLSNAGTVEKHKPGEKEMYLHKIQNLEKLAKEALESGNKALARRYLEEAEELEKILRQQKETDKHRDNGGKYTSSQEKLYLKKIKEFEKLAKEALESGNEAFARHYLKKAEEYERLLRARKGTDKHRDTGEKHKPSEKEMYLHKIKELERLAMEALERGDNAKARHYLKEAEELEKLLRHRKEMDKPKDTGEKHKPSEKELHKVKELKRLAREAYKRGDEDKGRYYEKKAWEEYLKILEQKK